MMLGEGLDVNGKSLGGSSHLHLAALYGHGLVVSLLLERGAKIEYNRHNLQAIHWAATTGHEEVVQILLDNGANINSSRHRGLTPLGVAAKNQQLSMMRFLLDKGADLAVKECGHDALQRAVRQGHEQVVRILAEAGVSVDAARGHCGPPLLIAMVYGQESMVKVLLELGATPIDPLESDLRAKFLDGTYPIPPSPSPILKK